MGYQQGQCADGESVWPNYRMMRRLAWLECSGKEGEEKVMTRS